MFLPVRRPPFLPQRSACRANVTRLHLSSSVTLVRFGRMFARGRVHPRGGRCSLSRFFALSSFHQPRTWRQSGRYNHHSVRMDLLYPQGHTGGRRVGRNTESISTSIHKNSKVARPTQSVSSAELVRRFQQRLTGRTSSISLTLEWLTTMINTCSGEASTIGVLTNGVLTLGTVVTERSSYLPLLVF